MQVSDANESTHQYNTLSRLSPFKTLFSNGCMARAVSALVSVPLKCAHRMAMLTYCVLDGLDECDEASLEILLEKFAALLSAKPDRSSVCRLNLLILSRELPDFIPELLSSFPRISLDPDADIDLFIKAKVNQLSLRFIGMKMQDI